MPNYPTGQQSAATYTLVGPNGSTAVFNNPSDSNFVMELDGDDAVSGLDSPEVRAAIQDKVEADGAVAGVFYHGIRSPVFNGKLYGTSTTQRNTRESLLRKVVNECMRADGTLSWTPTGGVSQYVKVRKHGRVSVKGGWRKDAQVVLVCPDHRIYSTTLNTSTFAHSTNQVLENSGDAHSPPALLRINGPSSGTATGPIIRRTWNGTQLNISCATMPIAAGQYVDIDVINKTATRNDGTNMYQYVSFLTTDWWEMGPGNNTIRLDWTSGTTTGTTLRVDWRHVWV